MRLQEEVERALLDMVFDARTFGSGATLSCHIFKLSEAEEAMRQVLGLSAYRKTLVLALAVQQAIDEKRHPKETEEGKILLNLFQDEAVETKGWNVDTVSRYLQVGKRLGGVELSTLTQTWEHHRKRESYVDSIASLRTAVASCQTEEELLYGLRTIFFEQRSNVEPGLRHALFKTNHPACFQGRAPQGDLPGVRR